MLQEFCPRQLRNQRCVEINPETCCHQRCISRRCANVDMFFWNYRFVTIYKTSEQLRMPKGTVYSDLGWRKNSERDFFARGIWNYSWQDETNASKMTIICYIFQYAPYRQKIVFIKKLFVFKIFLCSTQIFLTLHE